MCYMLRFKNRNYLTVREDANTLDILKRIDYLVNEKVDIDAEDFDFIVSAIRMYVIHNEPLVRGIKTNEDCLEAGRGLLFAYTYDKVGGINYGLFD